MLSKSIVQYDEALSSIKQCLAAYEDICVEQISNVTRSASLSEAEKSFDTLFSIQNQLSKLLFSRNIDIGPRLVTLTKEFDRLYDPYIREYWFKRFREGSTWPE